MSSLLNKKRDDKGTWHKVSDLRAGLQIAVPRPDADFDGSIEPSARSGDILWDKIVSIKPVGKEQVYDIEVEGTHNFVGNDIFAHNTYVIKSGNLTANAPDEVLTADKSGVDLAKLATHTLHDVQDLAAEFAAEDTKLVSLENRVEALESGNVGSGTLNFASSSLASAFESFGALIQKGIAQFNTLVFQRLVASTDSSGESSAGSVSIITGDTVAQVTNSLVLPSTKVFVTFNSQITGSWWVSDKTDGGFRVVLSEPQATDVSFDYFLVQTEGQISTSTSDTGSQTSNTNSGSQTSPTPIPPVVIATSTPDGTGRTGSTTPATSGIGTTTPASSDTILPVVTLLGDAAMQMATTSTPFADPGATALDDISGDLTASIAVTGSVDTTTAGVYTLTYTAKDAAGNVGTVSRVVTVVVPEAS